MLRGKLLRWNLSVSQPASWPEYMSFALECAVIESFYEEADFVDSAKQPHITCCWVV